MIYQQYFTLKKLIFFSIEYTGVIYEVHMISLLTFFVWAFKIGVDSWKFLWDDWPIFMISRSNEQLQQELEYTLLKPDCHSWWISIMQSGREDTWEERYAIKLCFKLGKNATETNGMLPRPRDRVPSGSMLALPDPTRPDRANPPTNFWWTFF